MESTDIEANNLLLLGCCAEGILIEHQLKQETQAQLQALEPLPSVSTNDVDSLLAEGNISITENTSIPTFNNDFYLDWESEIPNTDVKDVPQYELTFAEEEFHNSIGRAINNALT